MIKGLVLQQALWYCCSLRLAVLYDAPIEIKERILAEGQPFAAGAASLDMGTEWRFYMALHLLRTNPGNPRIKDARDHLCTMPLSTYCPVLY
jgi:hypothetical protein